MCCVRLAIKYELVDAVCVKAITMYDHVAALNCTSHYQTIIPTWLRINLRFQCLSGTLPPDTPTKFPLPPSPLPGGGGRGRVRKKGRGRGEEGGELGGVRLEERGKGEWERGRVEGEERRERKG